MPLIFSLEWLATHLLFYSGGDGHLSISLWRAWSFIAFPFGMGLPNGLLFDLKGMFTYFLFYLGRMATYLFYFGGDGHLFAFLFEGAGT